MIQWRRFIPAVLTGATGGPYWNRLHLCHDKPLNISLKFPFYYLKFVFLISCLIVLLFIKTGFYLLISKKLHWN